MSDFNPKFPGLNQNDTHWDSFHRERGMMTNREFFSSNGPGGFYEGMEWDEELKQWVPDARTREAEARFQEANKCSECGKYPCECW